jgi:hypothetical protein
MNHGYSTGDDGRERTPIRRRASEARPCAVCGSGSKGCSEADDGLILCRGTDAAPPGFSHIGAARGDPQFRLFRPTDPHATTAADRRPRSAPPTDWARRFARFREQLTPALRQELAEHLGVPVAALDRLAIGYTPEDCHAASIVGDNPYAPGGWVFAEADAERRIVGCLVRYRNKRKLSLAGGSRGLILPENWDHGDGPVLAVEGPSDVAALLGAGLSCVGRPSDRAGAAALRRLLSSLPPDRPILVVGENDPKPDGAWPGKDGARAVAQEIAAGLPNPVAWVLPPDRAKDVRAWLTAQADPWPARGSRLRDWLMSLRQPAHPVPPTAPPLPPFRPFPVDCLPGPFRAFVEETAASIGCDSAFVALPVLAVAASLIGNTRTVRLKRGWEEPSVLWTATVADSGSQKSPAYKAVMRPMYAVQKRLRAEFKAQMDQYERDLAAWKERQEEDRGEKPQKPTLRRVYVSDITIERLTEVLEDSPTGTLLARDELAGWVGSFTRYKAKGGGSDVANWLEMHGAGAVTYDRKHGDRRSVFVPAAAVSVTGTIQPGVLRRAMTLDLHESGLCARLLLSMPHRKKKKWTESEVHPDTLRAYDTVIDRLSCLAGELTLTLIPDAKRLWVAFYDDWAEVQHEADDALRPAFSKLEAYAPRFALVHHLVVQATLPAPQPDEPVGADSMAAGIALARWFAYETQRVYAMLAEDEGQRERRLLVEKVRDRGGRITARQLQRTNQKKYQTAAEAEADLDMLVRDGLGVWQDVPTTDRGGQPTREFVLRMTGDRTDTTGWPADNPKGPLCSDTTRPPNGTEPGPPSSTLSDPGGSVGSVTPSPCPDDPPTTGSAPEPWPPESPPSVTPDEQEGEL